MNRLLFALLCCTAFAFGCESSSDTDSSPGIVDEGGTSGSGGGQPDSGAQVGSGGQAGSGGSGVGVGGSGGLGEEAGLLEDAGSGEEAGFGGQAGSGSAGSGQEAGSAGQAGSGQGTCGASVPASASFSNNFDQDPTGTYTVDEMEADWNAPSWDNGVEDGRVSIIEGPDACDGRSLRVVYPQGGVGPSEGGAQWKLALDTTYDQLFLSYWLRFDEGFDFVKGGKLPGLMGGTANTGGDKPDGTDGFTARMMWRADGKVVQYVYHPDQPNSYGEDFEWNEGGQRYFVPGQWHNVEHRVVMNTPGQYDGIVEGWFDGELALHIDGLRFRTADAFSIDGLYFSTFFGGSGSDWAPTKDETIDFDGFVISTSAIGQ